MLEVTMGVSNEPVDTPVEKPAPDEAEWENKKGPSPLYIDEGCENVLQVP